MWSLSGEAGVIDRAPLTAGIHLHPTLTHKRPKLMRANVGWLVHFDLATAARAREDVSGLRRLRRRLVDHGDGIHFGHLALAVHREVRELVGQFIFVSQVVLYLGIVE